MSQSGDFERLSKLLDQLLRMSQGGTLLNFTQFAQDMVWVCELASKYLTLDKSLRQHPVQIASQWKDFYFNRIIAEDKTDGVRAETNAEINAFADLMAMLLTEEAPVRGNPARDLQEVANRD